MLLIGEKHLTFISSSLQCITFIVVNVSSGQILHAPCYFR